MTGGKESTRCGPPGLSPMTRRRTLPCLSLANPIRKTKEGNPNVGESGVKREVANLYTFAANT
jgi:hypothetical protein